MLLVPAQLLLSEGEDLRGAGAPGRPVDDDQALRPGKGGELPVLRVYPHKLDISDLRPLFQPTQRERRSGQRKSEHPHPKKKESHPPFSYHVFASIKIDSRTSPPYDGPIVHFFQWERFQNQVLHYTESFRKVIREKR
jgi:hypothetical protein